MLAEALALSAMVDVLCGRRLEEDKLARALALEDPERLVVAASRPTLFGGCCLLFVGDPRKRASTSWRCVSGCWSAARTASCQGPASTSRGSSAWVGT